MFKENKEQFGYRQLTKFTNEYYESIGLPRINHKKVLRIMKEQGIISKYVRKYIYKRRKAKVNKIWDFPDLVKRKYNIQKELTVLYTDVTYLVLNGKRMYQSTIIDACTKQIIDFQISKFNDLKLVLDNFNAAVIRIKKINSSTNGIIIHSDHGSQYISNAYKNRCHAEGIKISMGRVGQCSDNVVIESFHALLKKGTIHNNEYTDINAYVTDVIDWNNWYIFKKNKKLIEIFQ
ncbi:IS3 family transposase [Spiroplasma alleghenense]|uniref:IS3 family transposase n=1 Tax=Spiroplasma alleghenense TaxID=216931 RepID=UPI002481DC89|nr:IS3 family transposase [Spiroplasma alleghenense]